MMVNAGKPEQVGGPYYIDTICDYIKTLVETTGSKLPLEGRNISMDLLYTSVAIAKWLREKSITVIGTLMTNRIGIPDEVKAVRHSENFSTTVHFKEERKDMALCSYNVKTKSKGKKNVLMLTTMRPLLGITKDDGKNKPALYKLYDFTKGGDRHCGPKISYYTAKAKSSKWKMVAFYFILDTTRVNAQTILALKENKNPRKINSFEIGFDIVMSLVRPEMEKRPRNGKETKKWKGDQEMERRPRNGKETKKWKGDQEMERRPRNGKETKKWKGDQEMERRPRNGKETKKWKGDQEMERRPRNGKETKKWKGDQEMERRPRNGKETTKWKGDHEMEKRPRNGKETKKWFAKKYYSGD